MKSAYRQMERSWKSPKEMEGWKPMLIQFRRE
jgi:hypothetical protein